MRRACLVLALAVVFALPAAAQDVPFAERGDLAVVAAFGSVNINQLPPALSAAGVRYWIGNRTVLGAAVSLNVASYRQGTEESDRGNAGLEVWSERHVGRRSRSVSPFVGAGVRASRSHDRGRGPCPDPVACLPGVEGLHARTLVSAGAGVLAGAEVRLYRGVTLGAAATLGVDVQRDTRTFTPDGGAPVDLDSFRGVVLRTGGTDLHLSVYF